jgi:hypothetical protein
MKNILEYTLLEVEALMHSDPEAPQKQLLEIQRYVKQAQQKQYEYQVQKELAPKQAEAPQAPSRKQVRSLDQELLDTAEIVYVTEELDPEDSQERTGS